MTQLKQRVNIHPICFTGLGKYGDFDFMIQEDIKKNINHTLYIYNDNCEHHKTKSFRQGLGNAIIRKYNQYNVLLNRPYSAGIPTGHLYGGGFKELDAETQNVIDNAISEIKIIIEKYNITDIYYSINNSDDILIGQSIFVINDSVRQYITDLIYKL